MRAVYNVRLQRTICRHRLFSCCSLGRGPRKVTTCIPKLWSTPASADENTRLAMSRKQQAQIRALVTPLDQQEQNGSIDPPSKRKSTRKKLRQLEHQRDTLSAFIHLLQSAQSCTFTGSVRVSGADDAGQHPAGDLDGTTTSAGHHRQATVVTSCAQINPATFQSKDDAATSTSSHVIIRVQPLLVLDLNGILCLRVRPHKHGPYNTNIFRPKLGRHVANSDVVPRPHLTEFLQWLDVHFCLAIWTSAKAKTARQLVDLLIPADLQAHLLFVWAQHHCDAKRSAAPSGDDDDNGQHDTLFQKDLAKVWRTYPLWNVSNTVLVDDSRDKCAQWHENAWHPRPLDGRRYENSEDLTIVQEQRDFLEGLIEHWNNWPGRQHWDEESGDVVLPDAEAQRHFIRDYEGRTDQRLHGSESGFCT